MCYCGNKGCNGYGTKSQHRKSTLEKKIIPPLLQGFEPATFQSRVRCSDHSAIPAPRGKHPQLHMIHAHALEKKPSGKKVPCLQNSATMQVSATAIARSNQR